MALERDPPHLGDIGEREPEREPDPDRQYEKHAERMREKSMTAKPQSDESSNERSEWTPVEAGTVLRDTEEERTMLVTGVSDGVLTAVEVESATVVEQPGPTPYVGQEEAFVWLNQGRRFAPVGE